MVGGESGSDNSSFETADFGAFEVLSMIKGAVRPEKSPSCSLYGPPVYSHSHLLLKSWFLLLHFPPRGRRLTSTDWTAPPRGSHWWEIRNHPLFSIPCNEDPHPNPTGFYWGWISFYGSLHPAPCGSDLHLHQHHLSVLSHIMSSLEVFIDRFTVSFNQNPRETLEKSNLFQSMLPSVTLQGLSNYCDLSIIYVEVCTVQY